MKKKEVASKKDITKYTCTWPREVHALMKISATMKYETLNEWVLRAILLQLEDEKKNK